MVSQPEIWAGNRIASRDRNFVVVPMPPYSYFCVSALSEGLLKSVVVGFFMCLGALASSLLSEQPSPTPQCQAAGLQNGSTVLLRQVQHSCHIFNDWHLTGHYLLPFTPFVFFF